MNSPFESRDRRYQCYKLCSTLKRQIAKLSQYSDNKNRDHVQVTQGIVTIYTDRNRILFAILFRTFYYENKTSCTSFECTFIIADRQVRSSSSTTFTSTKITRTWSIRYVKIFSTRSGIARNMSSRCIVKFTRRFQFDDIRLRWFKFRSARRSILIIMGPRSFLFSHADSLDTRMHYERSLCSNGGCIVHRVLDEMVAHLLFLHVPYN